MAAIKNVTLRARDNPFAVDRVLQIRYRFETDSLDTLCAKLELHGWRGAIVGPQGSGKTTLLEDLADRLAGDGWRILGARLSEEHPRFERAWLRRFVADLGPHDLIVLDGAEQLSRWGWRRFQKLCRAAGGLIITTHGHGLLPTVYETSVSQQMLDEILDVLVPKAPSVVRREACRLFALHCGNIRDVLRSLYDLWAEGRFASENDVAKASDSVDCTQVEALL